MMITTFVRRVSLHDSSQAAELFECSTCEAAIVEVNSGDESRTKHRHWHSANAIGLG